MGRRPRRNHGPAFKAKVAVAAIRGEKTLIELAQDFDVQFGDRHARRAQDTFHPIATPAADGRGTGRPDRKRTLAGHGAETVRDAITATIVDLPAHLRRSLTWYQGAEMAQHERLRIDTGLDIYFCDPQSPWQRGSNENTNCLLRQYFPKGTDLSLHGVDELNAVAHALNTRPRKTLGWRTPAEAFEDVLKHAVNDRVPTTG